MDSREENSPDTPDFIYKYVAPPTSLDDSCKSVFWERCFTTIKFKDPKDLNDPFDMKANIVFDGTDDDWRLFFRTTLKKSFPHLSEQDLEGEVEHQMSLPRVARQLDFIDSMNQATDNLVVCCLTEKKDNILMWSHYADSHRGVCLEYNSKVLTRSPQGSPEYFKKVEYHAKFLSFKNIFEMDSDRRAHRILCAKSKDWDYENEWRIIQQKQNCPRYEPLQTGILTGVIFGCNMSLADRNQIKILLEKINPSVELYEADKDKTGYEMAVKKCPPHESKNTDGET